MGFPGGSVVKNPPIMQEPQEIWVQSLGWEDPLGEGIATHSSILAWRIPMDRGGWWAIIHRVTKRQTRWSDWAHMHATQQATLTNTLIPYGLVITLLVYQTLCMFFSLNMYPSANPIIYYHLMSSQIHYSLEMLKCLTPGFQRGKSGLGYGLIPTPRALWYLYGLYYVLSRLVGGTLPSFLPTVVVIVIWLKPRPFYSIKGLSLKQQWCQELILISSYSWDRTPGYGQRYNTYSYLTSVITKNKEGKKKERESSKSQEHVGLIPRNMLLKVTFLEPPIYLFVNKPVKIRSLQGPAPCLLLLCSGK